jgi:hypothetical protein
MESIIYGSSYSFLKFGLQSMGGFSSGENTGSFITLYLSDPSQPPRKGGVRRSEATVSQKIIAILMLFPLKNNHFRYGISICNS